MAETLTQEQIDALLSSALNGDMVETSKEADVKEYDFRAPKKFTKERIKILDSIFDNYARLLSSYLTGLLRLYCKVSLSSIEEQRYFEFFKKAVFLSSVSPSYLGRCLLGPPCILFSFL